MWRKEHTDGGGGGGVNGIISVFSDVKTISILFSPFIFSYSQSLKHLFDYHYTVT